MDVVLRRATADDIRAFAAWRYEPPYDVYDITEGEEDAVTYFLDPDVQCHVLIEGGDLAGFCTFGQDAWVPGGNYEADAVDIGLGVRPDLTGAGRGISYVAAVVAFARDRFGHKPLRVTIAAGNQRAQRVWSKAGFVETSRFVASKELMGDREFVILERG